MGVCRGRKSTKEKWPLEVRSKRPTGQIAEPLGMLVVRRALMLLLCLNFRSRNDTENRV